MSSGQSSNQYAYLLYVCILYVSLVFTLIICMLTIKRATKTVMTTSFDFTQAPGYLIRRAHQTSMAIFAEELGSYEVTSLQFAILQALIDEPGSDQITVAQRVALDAATSGSVIMRLEERGWLRREASPTDKRRKLLWLTASGEKMAMDMKKPARRVQQRLLANLTALEREQLIELLQRVSETDA